MKQKLIPKGQSGLLTTPFTYKDFISQIDPKTQKIIQDKAIADEVIATNPTIQTSLKDKPLSPNDPVGEFYVGTAAGKILEYPIKLIGKASLYGLGRLGNNWARAKLISGTLNSAPQKYFGTVKYYGPTMGKTTAAKTNHDIVDFDDYAREATKELAKKHGLTKQQLQISPRLEQEYKNMLLGLVEKWRRDPNNAFKTLVVSKKVLANEPIYSNIPSIPDRATFLKRQALRGERFPFRADDYYDALKSANPNLKINNNFVSDLEYNPHYISVKPATKTTIDNNKNIYLSHKQNRIQEKDDFDSENFMDKIYSELALKNPLGQVANMFNPQRINASQNVQELFRSTVFPRIQKQRPWITQNVGENFKFDDIYVFPNKVFENSKSHKKSKGFYNKKQDIVVVRDFDDLELDDVIGHELRHRADVEYPLTEAEEKIASKAYSGFQNAAPKENLNYNMKVDIPTTNYESRNIVLDIMFQEQKMGGKFKNYNDFTKIPIEEQNALIDAADNDLIIDAIENSNGYGEKFIRYLRDNNLLTPERIQDLKEAMKIIGVSASVYPLIKQKQNDIRRNNN